MGENRFTLQVPVVHKQRRFNNRFLGERGMASNPKMEYQVFLCIFQKNSAMATLCLKEMGKFSKLRQPKGQTFFPTFPKEFSHFLQT